jgi:opacity protein-like surface antigen
LKFGIRLTITLLFAAAVLPAAHAQANSTDIRSLQLYAFGGATGTYTGLNAGRNLGITAGIDLGFSGYHGFLPLLEVRGTEPFDDGGVDAQKNFLGGLKVERRYGGFHPYVDFLYGRGQIDYQGAGYINPAGDILYQQTNSNIYAFGGGVDYDISSTLAIKADIQIQHWVVPVTTSGDLYSKPITLGVLYRFGYGRSRPQ